MSREKLNGQRTAGEIINERLQGKNSPSERIGVLGKIVEEFKTSSRMDIFVQAASMLSSERGKQKSLCSKQPLTEDISAGNGLMAAKALSGFGGC